MGTAMGGVISAILVPQIRQLLREINDVIRLDENSEQLKPALSTMRNLLGEVITHRQTTAAPETVKNNLQRIEEEVKKGRELLYCLQRPQPFIDCLLCKPQLSTQIENWKKSFDELFQEVETGFSASLQEELYSQLAGSELVGSGIKLADTQLKRCLEAPGVRIIGLYGDEGTGKTTLLKQIYNNYKVSNLFDVVIWLTVGDFTIPELHDCINEAIKLENRGTSNDPDHTRKAFSAYLKEKSFLLVLSNMTKPLTLNELGVEFGDDKGSKVLFSTRYRSLVPAMKAEESIEIQPLLAEEAWELFCKVAFKDGLVPQELVENGRHTAYFCRRVPLLLNVVAATKLLNMQGATDWGLALSGLRKYVVRPLNRINLLKWSYHSLLDANMKNCFLYCAMFPQDLMINIKMMVEKWIAEGLVNIIDVSYLGDCPSHRYLKLLIDRRLFEIPISMTIENRNQHYLKSHAVVRQMATQVGEEEEHCLLRPGKRLEHFPSMEIKEDCRRISLYGNNITSLPSTELRCPNLVALILTGNRGLQEVPEKFLANLVSLKVLDLSRTQIKSLPRSLWQISQLRSLNLSYTKIEEVPQSVGNLKHLQFLYLVNCINLKSLPSQIGDLQDLTCLDLWDCHNMKSIPTEITALSGCKIMKNSIVIS